MDILTFIAIIAAAIIVYLLLKNRENDNSSLKTELTEIRREINEFQKTHTDSLHNQYKSLNSQYQESVKIVRDVTSQLEKMHTDHKNVIDVKSQLNKLTDILANPKQRGILGEYFLETLLKNVFTPDQYKLQYKFKDGKIADAAIFIRDKILPIDSKFSLENYNKVAEEKDLAQREKLEKLFKQDLKYRIEETAQYIKPQEGTMDFAFMFIPSEGIYYDLLINQIGAIKVNTYNLIEYAFKEKHVIIVSPTSFYAYLQTVLQGLRALKIEESAKQIRKQVENFQRHLLNYDVFVKKLGVHLGTTVNTYNQSYKEFNKINKDVLKITGGKQTIEPVQLEKPEEHLEDNL